MKNPDQLAVLALNGSAVLLCVVGVYMMIALYRPVGPYSMYYPEQMMPLGTEPNHSIRFRGDNAQGATANATEFIAENMHLAGVNYPPGAVVGAVLMLCGFVAWGVAQLILIKVELTKNRVPS